ncbi:MAG TPA: hypothetical protein HA272_03830 [Methanoregula sp.]|nr:hypothetical protein [Methanoregula sp.]
MPNDRAISESVSIILIISLVVILFIVLAALFLGEFHLEQKTAYIMTNLSSEKISGKNVLTVFHRAGDAAELNQTGRAHYTLAVYVDTLSGSNRTQPVGPIVFQPGTTLYIYNSSMGYRATTNPAALSAPTALSVDACPVRVRLVDETSSTHLLIMQMNYPCTPTGPAPTVTSINVTYGYRGWPIARLITGTNFLPGARAMFNLTAGIPPEIHATSCTALNSTRMVCTFTLPTNPLAPPSQRYNLVVTNPDGKQGMRRNYPYVYSAAPSISSSTPSSGLQGATVAITYLRGNYFQPGATVTYHQSPTVIPLTGVTVHNATRITGTLAIPDDALPGYYNVTVTNVDGRNYTRATRFRVISNAPTVTGLSNRTGYRGWPVIERITGTNFVDGATAAFEAPGLATIPSDSCTWVASTQLICSFNLVGYPNSTTYQYNISVTNPGGRTGWRATYFTLSSPAPTISSSTPSSGQQGETVAITNLRGNYFQPDAVVTYWYGDPAAPSTSLGLASVAVPSRTMITGTLSIPADAPAGYYNVTVLNTDGKSVTRRNAFRVISTFPTVTGLSNRTGYRGWPVIERITGSNFIDGATARFEGPGLATITADSCTYVSATQMICTFNLLGRSASPANGYNITVVNPDGKTGQRSSYFTLSSPAPYISSSTPSSGIAGNAVPITNLRGNYFQPGAEVTYWRGDPASPLTTMPLIVESIPARTQITGTLNIPAGASIGYYNITVLNTDGQSYTRRNAFRVWAVPAPTITGISPGTGGRGIGVPVTVTGTNIQAGARVRLYNGTTSIYTAPLGTVTPPNTISTTFMVLPTVVPGTMNVRVTNPDGQYAILAGGYVLT